jgi:acetyl esterase/lipase
MKLTTETVKRRLTLMKPLLTRSTLAAARAGQQAIGELMSLGVRGRERFEVIPFRRFPCGLVTPETVSDPEAAVLYLHGGGYVGGGLEYARGFGSILASETGLRVFCPAYRLAPEHPFPAALKDALVTYRYLTNRLGIDPSKLILCGESAGGGLIYSLCLMLKRMKKPLPAGLAAISPWTDLTLSGASYEENRDKDPSMTRERLRYFAECYGGNPLDPLVSPLYGDLEGLPPSLIFSGGDEIMLSDAADLHEKLLAAGAGSCHILGTGLWHAYLLYGLEDRKEDMARLRDFIKESVSHE